MIPSTTCNTLSNQYFTHIEQISATLMDPSIDTNDKFRVVGETIKLGAHIVVDHENEIKKLKEENLETKIKFEECNEKLKESNQKVVNVYKEMLSREAKRKIGAQTVGAYTLRSMEVGLKGVGYPTSLALIGLPVLFAGFACEWGRERAFIELQMLKDFPGGVEIKEIKERYFDIHLSHIDLVFNLKESYKEKAIRFELDNGGKPGIFGMETPKAVRIESDKIYSKVYALIIRAEEHRQKELDKLKQDYDMMVCNHFEKKDNS